MELGLVVAIVWILGMTLAIPALIWFARDLGRIHGPDWYWKGHHREPWQWAVLIGWVAGGWPAIVIIFVWWRSGIRQDLLTDASGETHHRRRSTDG